MAILAELAGKECIFQRHPYVIEATCSLYTVAAGLSEKLHVTVDVNPDKARLTTLIQDHCYLHQTWCARR